VAGVAFFALISMLCYGRYANTQRLMLRRRRKTGTPQQPPSASASHRTWRGRGECPAVHDQVKSVRQISRADYGSLVYVLHTDRSKMFVKLHGHTWHGPVGTSRPPTEAWAEVYASQLANILGMDNMHCSVGFKLRLNRNLSILCTTDPDKCPVVDRKVTSVYQDPEGLYALAAALAPVKEWRSHDDLEYRAGTGIPMRLANEIRTALTSGLVPTSKVQLQVARDASSMMVLDFVLDNRDQQWLYIRRGPQIQRVVQVDKASTWAGLREGMCPRLQRQGVLDALRSRVFGEGGVQFSVQMHTPENRPDTLRRGWSQLCTFPRALAGALGSNRGVDGILDAMDAVEKEDPLLSAPIQPFILQNSNALWKLVAQNTETSLLRECMQAQLLLVASAIQRCSSESRLVLV
jgi:hypothetical protein